MRQAGATPAPPSDVPRVIDFEVRLARQGGPRHRKKSLDTPKLLFTDPGEIRTPGS
jgi:hypothetical protein